MRKKKVIINAFALAFSEIISMICGLILPRLILKSFGSDYNGIISSIKQIISFVTLLRAGVGGVTRAALYKPLAENNINEISAIVNTTEQFMRKIALIFAVAILGLATVYPFFVDEFDWLFSFTLFLILSISTFIQYYFGITYQMLLIADQRNYIYTLINIVSVIINTLLGVLLINIGCSIHVVKLGSAVAFAITPIFLYTYARKKFLIDKKVKPNRSALKQRWDALGHQIAYYILTSTDLTILTLFASVSYVSIYSVYMLVIKAIKTIIKTYSSSVEAAFGNMIAKNERGTLNRSLNLFEELMFLSCAFLFTITAILIVPFVKVYTSGITDADYIQPIFAWILIIGEFLYCVRIPYMSVVEASGYYKSTKTGAYIEAIINVVLSVVLCLVINPLIGVAVGTLVALLIRTVEISRYVDRKVLNRTRIHFYKGIIISCIIAVTSMLVCNSISLFQDPSNYYQWVARALIVTIVVAIITLVFAFTIYKSQTRQMVVIFSSLIRKRKENNN